MIADLHVHSRRSDGSLTVAEFSPRPGGGARGYIDRRPRHDPRLRGGARAEPAQA